MTIDEGEYDAIFDEGYEQAVHCWGPAYTNRPPCPYPEGSEKAEAWTKGLFAGLAKQHD